MTTVTAEPTAPRRRHNDRPTTCTVEGCDKPHKGLGYCLAHYHRYRRHGDPTAGGGRRPGRTPFFTDAILEDLAWMAKHGEDSYGAATRISNHTDVATPVDRDTLVDKLRDAGKRGLAAALIVNDEISDEEMTGTFNLKGVVQAQARAVIEQSAAKWLRGGDA